MKRLIAFFLIIIHLVSLSACAEPLRLADDYQGKIVIPYDTDPSSGSFVFSYRYPCIDPSEEDASIVNSFYLEQIDMDESNMQFFADGYAETGESVSKEVHYQITCNNDDYFSVLIIQDLAVSDHKRTIWSGNTFSRNNGEIGSAFDLPRILGILDSQELDDDRIEYQSEKAEDIVLEMMMDRIFENPDNIPYFPDVTYLYLKSYVSPKEDFYLDESGNPVFFIVPGVVADESEGYLEYPILLEDIMDEL